MRKYPLLSEYGTLYAEETAFTYRAFLRPEKEMTERGRMCIMKLWRFRKEIQKRYGEKG